MAKTITVKGTGKASATPDRIVLSMLLEALNRVYDKAMLQSEKNINELTDALVQAGIEKRDLKTAYFDVRTEHHSIKDRNGNYKNVFDGYKVSQSLKLELEMDTKKLARALAAVGGCACAPEVTISFIVKDTAAVNEEVLRSATENARRKAEILCGASGMHLGELVTVYYDWGEVDVYSRTKYLMPICDCNEMPEPKYSGIEMEPEDVDFSDTVTFVWEMV